MAVMAVLLSGAGCAEEEAPAARRPLDASVTSPTTTAAETTTTTTAPVDPVRVEVEAAYRNAVRVAEEAAMIPDPDAPELAQWNTGPMLEEWRRRIEELRANGHRISFPVPSGRRIEVVAFEIPAPDEAVIEVCSRDDAVVSEIATGKVVNDRITVSTKRALLRKEDGWKLAERVDTGGGSVVQCFEG